MAEKTVAELLEDRKLQEKIAKVKAAREAGEESIPLTAEENERARKLQIEQDAKAADERLANQRRRSTDAKPDADAADPYSRNVGQARDIPTGPGSATDKLERIKRGEAVDFDSTPDEHPEVVSAKEQAEKAQKKVTVAKTKVEAQKAKEVHDEAKAAVNDPTVKPEEVEAAVAKPTKNLPATVKPETVDAEHIPPSKGGVPTKQQEVHLADWADNVAESVPKQEALKAQVAKATPAQIEAAASHLPPGTQAEVASLAHSGNGRGRILGTVLALGAGAAYAFYNKLSSDAPAQTATPASSPTPTSAAAPAAGTGSKEGERRETKEGWAVYKDGKWQLESASTGTKTPAASTAIKPNKADYVVSQKELDARMAKLAAIPRTLSPEAQATYDARRKEIQTLLDDAETRFKDRENTTQWAQVAELVGHALTRLGAGYYGLKTGYDLSGVPFQKNDWQKEMDRLYDHYDKTVTRNLKQKEAVYEDQAAAEKNVATSGHARAQEMENLWKGQDEGRRAFGRDTVLGQITTAKETGATERAKGKNDAKTESAEEKADAAAEKERIRQENKDIKDIDNAKGTKKKNLIKTFLASHGVSKEQIEDADHWYTYGDSSLEGVYDKVKNSALLNRTK